ncbi:MAG: ABC transporter ATP-binding protein [Sedimentisphaerales bacterium]|nr:ABC transporter ATP-binding protein [Sedimentisphaerales bacterium]
MISDNYIIQVSDLGKKYIIGHQKQAHYHTLRDSMAHWGRGIWQRLRRPLSPNQEKVDLEEFWALKDINFEMPQGERVGIIGPNGAGKSTLLKILSRITEPTTGRVHIRGRVSSLLEVGTGFHPELTGRENIFLNGAILGMTRAEIKRKFDEIVAFAEVEKFLDTPVKRYSSGMYVRLAFAVAAHLEPEILIVDEVLAVGDGQFQKKCLRKMEDVGQEGRTVLFVSHNMPMIASLCDRCILLNNGRICEYDTTKKVIDLYYSKDGIGNGEVDFTRRDRQPGDKSARLLKVRTLNSQGETTTEIRIDEPVTVEMEYELLADNLGVTPEFVFWNAEGVCVFDAQDTPVDPRGELKKEKGLYLARCHIPPDFLNDGTYYIGFLLSKAFKTNWHFNEKDILMLRIVDPLDNIITRGWYSGKIPGVVRPVLQWESVKMSYN